jgi:hypothetical protein
MDAKAARELSVSRTGPSLDKVLTEVLKAIEEAANNGEFTVDYKFPDGTSVNVVRQVQLKLTNKGYSVSTILYDNIKDSDPLNDIIMTYFGIFQLFNLNQYASFDKYALRISW